MNKRLLKKEIRRVTNDMAAVSILSASLIADTDAIKLDEAATQALSLQAETLKAVNNRFDKRAKDFDTKEAYLKARAAYHRAAIAAVKRDFHTRSEEVIHLINSAITKK